MILPDVNITVYLDEVVIMPGGTDSVQFLSVPPRNLILATAFQHHCRQTIEDNPVQYSGDLSDLSVDLTDGMVLWLAHL